MERLIPVIIGSIVKDDSRFIAIDHGDYEQLLKDKVIGKEGYVTTRADGLSFFKPD